MQPKLLLPDDELIARILNEAYQLMLKPGIKVNNEEARELLGSAERAKVMVKKLMETCKRPQMDSAKENELHAYMLNLAEKAGVEKLPSLEEFQFT